MSDERALGATHLGDGQTRFRVWAPERRTVDVCLEEKTGRRFFPLSRVDGGWFEGVVPAEPGALYRYRLDGDGCFPDPSSRFQPEGPHGPSEIIDPRSFSWSDAGWKGRTLRGQVIYELHVGAFTPQGNYAGVIEKLPYLKDVGVTVLELMPVNGFPGRFNWGYDGVNLFAPCSVYGRPDDLRKLVDAAHRLELSVILDVVYNHLGPDGNYLAQFSKGYVTRKHRTDWGEALAFDGPAAKPVRQLFTQNAAYWIADYHFDGLRLDATQNLYDDSPRHILADIAAAARAAAPDRALILIAENDAQVLRLVDSPEQGGHGFDAIWIDDFHHAATVALTGVAESYLGGYLGTAQELVSCATRNSLYQGQRFPAWNGPRGGVLRDVEAEHAVFFLENHDQVSNSLTGDRLHRLAGEKRTRAMTAWWLLSPQTPMLFMGQERFASSPFVFFADHAGDLQKQVRLGRAGFLSQFASARHAIEHEGYVPLHGEEAFARSKLDWSELAHRGPALAFTQQLLRLRRDDPVFAAQDIRRVSGAVLGPDCALLRFFGDDRDGDRLVIMNLGVQRDLVPCSEPLLAPKADCRWAPVLSSEDSRYGGSGATFPDERTWVIPGHATVVLTSTPRDATAA